VAYKWNFNTETSFEIATKEILEEMWREQNELIMRDWSPDDIRVLPDDAILFNFDDLLPEDICAILFPHIDAEINEIEIQFDCHGAHYPGVHYTPNGDGYPDEWDEERIITAIIIGDKTFTEKDPEFGVLERQFQDPIDEMELDNSVYDEQEE
jgi:hypothetical protein